MFCRILKDIYACKNITEQMNLLKMCAPQILIRTAKTIGLVTLAVVSRSVMLP